MTLYPLPAIKVDPLAAPAGVTIQYANGATTAVTSDSAGLVSVDMPATIAVPTTFYVPGEGSYVVTTISGAGTFTSTQAVTLEDNQEASLTVPATVTPTVLGQVNTRRTLLPHAPARPIICGSGVGSTSLPASYGAAGCNHIAGILGWNAHQANAFGPVDLTQVPSPLTDQSPVTQAQACANALMLGMIWDLGLQLNPTFDQSTATLPVEQMKDYQGNLWPGVSNQNTGAGVFSNRHWTYLGDYLTKLIAQFAATTITLPDGSTAGKTTRMLDYAVGFKVGGMQNNEPRYGGYNDADSGTAIATANYVPSLRNPVFSVASSDSFAFTTDAVWQGGPAIVSVSSSGTGGVFTGNISGTTFSNVHDLTAGIGGDGYPHTYAVGTTLKLVSIWAYGSLPQTGTNASGDTLPPGMTPAPIAGYIPYIGVGTTGAQWSAANDAAFWAWYQNCLNLYVNFILTTLSNALIANNAPNVILWVSHPDVGLRNIPVISNATTGGTTNAIMQPGLAMLAEGLHTSSLMATYGKTANFPYPVVVAPNCTGFDLGYGNTATAAATAPNSQWFYYLAKQQGLTGYMIGENSSSSPNYQQIFSAGGAMTNYYGILAAVGTTPGTTQLAALALQAIPFLAPISSSALTTWNGAIFGGKIWGGTGVPTTAMASTAAAIGDLYIRTDTPSTTNQRLYMCSVAGTPGTWVALV